MLNVLKVFIGIILGVLTMGVLSASAGYYFFVTNLSAKPTKPKFAEERNPTLVKKPVAKPSAEPEDKKTATPTPSPTPSASALPPGAYDATVSWKDGVSLRKEPTEGSEKTGSVGFNEKIVVLQENDAKTWVQVRNAEGSAEGWLKSGNIQRDTANN